MLNLERNFYCKWNPRNHCQRLRLMSGDNVCRKKEPRSLLRTTLQVVALFIRLSLRARDAENNLILPPTRTLSQRYRTVGRPAWYCASRRRWAAPGDRPRFWPGHCMRGSSGGSFGGADWSRWIHAYINLCVCRHPYMYVYHHVHYLYT